jgi:hypothetical protein
MYIRIITLFALFFGLTNLGCAQTAKPALYASVAFWNIENLFDTVDDPHVNDEEFTPEGSNHWNETRYNQKLTQLSKVIKQLGDPNGPEIIGLCEVENRKVLEDLVAHDSLKALNYGIIHYDGWDYRGVDCALLYKKDVFKPITSWTVRLHDPSDAKWHTRDQLWVKGVLITDTIYFSVNHWPSRRGGAAKSEPKRIMAAQYCRKTVDSLLLVNPNAKIIIMGDFNDDPNNKSVYETLKARPAKKMDSPEQLYNPMFELFKFGEGSLSHAGSWNLFDMHILSQGLVSNSNKKFGYLPESAHVFSPRFLRVPEGSQYESTPRRTYAGGKYDPQGFSDHFPSYVILMMQR